MMYLHVIYSTFANGEVKEFKEVRAICFIAKYTTKKSYSYTNTSRAHSKKKWALDV